MAQAGLVRSQALRGTCNAPKRGEAGGRYRDVSAFEWCVGGALRVSTVIGHTHTRTHKLQTPPPTPQNQLQQRHKHQRKKSTCPQNHAREGLGLAQKECECSGVLSNT